YQFHSSVVHEDGVCGNVAPGVLQRGKEGDDVRTGSDVRGVISLRVEHLDRGAEAVCFHVVEESGNARTLGGGRGGVEAPDVCVADFRGMSECVGKDLGRGWGGTVGEAIGPIIGARGKRGGWPGEGEAAFKGVERVACGAKVKGEVSIAVLCRDPW